MRMPLSQPANAVCITQAPLTVLPTVHAWAGFAWETRCQLGNIDPRLSSSGWPPSADRVSPFGALPNFAVYLVPMGPTFRYGSRKLISAVAEKALPPLLSTKSTQLEGTQLTTAGTGVEVNASQVGTQIVRSESQTPFGPWY